jgi:hypothetical protein
LSPIGSPSFELGPPSEDAIELPRRRPRHPSLKRHRQDEALHRAWRACLHAHGRCLRARASR